MGHFRVVLSLCFKARLSAKPFFNLIQIKLFRFRTQPRFEVRVVGTLNWPTAGLFLTSSNFKIKIFRFSELFVLSDIRTTQDYLSLQKFSVSLFCKPCTLGDDLYAGSPKLSTRYVLPIVFHISEPVIPRLRISEYLIRQNLSIYNI